MLILTCPNCGTTAEETEFHAGGEAHLKRFGPGSSDTEFEQYLFMRDNPKGVHFERWRHVYGCGKWFSRRARYHDARGVRDLYRPDQHRSARYHQQD